MYKMKYFSPLLKKLIFIDYFNKIRLFSYMNKIFILVKYTCLEELHIYSHVLMSGFCTFPSPTGLCGCLVSIYILSFRPHIDLNRVLQIP